MPDLEIIERLRDLGAYGALILAILGGFRGWYVWRWVYDEQKAETVKALAERDEWKNIALNGLGIAERLVMRRPIP